jgi:tetratricopeptide (TPR) repeat protein
MTNTLDQLLARSLALSDQLGVDEALEINQAILELDPANELAATRLGIGLLNAGRLKEAIAILEEAVRAHPENTVADKRLQQAVRDIATAAVPKPRRRPKARIAREVWVKAMEYKAGWTAKPGGLTWVNDAGIIDHNGRRKLRDNGQPWGEPSWRVGDQVGLCLGGTVTISVLAEIAQRPVFDPAFVASQSGSAEDGERWPWVTEVRVITTLPPDSAPTLEELSISAKSMPQRARKQLDPTQSGLLLGRYGRS